MLPPAKTVLQIISPGSESAAFLRGGQLGQWSCKTRGPRWTWTPCGMFQRKHCIPFASHRKGQIPSLALGLFFMGHNLVGKLSSRGTLPSRSRSSYVWEKTSEERVAWETWCGIWLVGIPLSGASVWGGQKWAWMSGPGKKHAAQKEKMKRSVLPDLLLIFLYF